MRNTIWFLGVALLALSTLLCAGQALRYYRAWKIARVHPVYDRTFVEANRELAATTGTRMVLFGDSRIAQWDPLPALGSVQLVNRGIGGETTEQMRFRFEADVLDLEPDWVLLQAGINDLVAASLEGPHGAETARRAADNLASFVTASRARGIRVALLSVIPSARRDLPRVLLWPASLNEDVEELNALLVPLSQREGVVWVDTAATLKDAAGDWHPHVNADTLHLTREGYARLNRALELALGSERDAVQ